MRKLSYLLLLCLFLSASTASPALGFDYRETALAYLMNRHSVPAERIELYEGSVIKLEFTAESFWSARYIISFEGKSDFPGEARTLPLTEPEPMPLPAPNVWPNDRMDIRPLPPQDVIDGGGANDSYTYGGVHIRIKTGEILESEQMDAFYAAEWRLAQQEWERLRKEAGKLDVTLYKNLQRLPVTEKVVVWIHPTPVKTDEVKSQFAALKEKYPDFTSGMELEDYIFHGYGYAVPGIYREGASSPGVYSENASSAADTPVSYAVPDPAMPLERPDDGVPSAMPDYEYSEKYTAMWEELEQIRIQAMPPRWMILRLPSTVWV